MQFDPGVPIASHGVSVHHHHGQHGDHHRRGKRNRHVRAGVRAAVVRAYAAAQLVRDKMVLTPTIQAAAVSCGACPVYVSAVLAILQSGDHELINRVMLGKVSLLTAARRVKALSALVEAYRNADLATRIEFGRQIGVANLWDDSIAPAL